MAFLGTVREEVAALGGGYNIRVFDQFGARIICSFRSCEDVPLSVANAFVSCVFANADFPVFDMFVKGF